MFPQTGIASKKSLIYFQERAGVVDVLSVKGVDYLEKCGYDLIQNKEVKRCRQR